MKYFSMFSGVGGFEKGIEQAYESFTASARTQLGISQREGDNADNQQIIIGTQQPDRGTENHSHEQIGQSDGAQSSGSLAVGSEPQLPSCVGYSEIDRFASAIYRFNFPEHRNFGDATGIVPGELPDFDLLVAGFPCQDFSIAGKRQGFNNARGTLFFEIARVLSHKRPAHFLLENVAGLASHNDGKTQQEIFRILSEIGYFVERPLLNSKDFGVPQNRERVFFIGHLTGECEREILSFGKGNDWDFETLRERSVVRGRGKNTSGCLDTRGVNAYDRADLDKLIFEEPKIFDFNGARNSGGMAVREHTDGSVRALKAMHSGTSAPMTTTSQNRVRRLTPIEYARLQGFPDDWAKYGMFDDGVKEISDTQQYKVFGNAVTTKVIEALILRMLEKGCLASSMNKPEK